jgi:uncharacterized protein DUF1186/SEC-C motif-containing protein
VWSALANYCTDLYPAEVEVEIQQAYGDGLIEPRAIHPDDVQEALALGRDEALKRFLRRRYRLIDDVEKEMSWFSCFEPASASGGKPRSVPTDPLRSMPVEPLRRPSPKVGRNDPCPCGSGKKFKKCCGK